MATISGFQRIWAIALLSAITALADPPPGFHWTQTFDDEFTGTALDTTKWHPHDHFCGTRNDEVQGYVPENVSVANGVCQLKGEKRTVNYGYCGNAGNSKSYASGIIISQKKFAQRYGYFEARMKLPRGRSMWPAFWCLTDDIPSLGTGGGWPPEVDILELINGGDGNQYGYATAWYTASSYPNCNGSGGGADYWNSWSGSKDLSAEFFLTAMLWTPDSVVFYADNKKVGKWTQHLQWNCPFFMLLNLAMKPGPNDAMLPAYVSIDWVRVWQYGTVDVGPSRTKPMQPAIVPAYTNGQLRINAPAAVSYACSVTDATGRVRASHEGTGPWAAPISLTKGIYFLTLTRETRTASGRFAVRP
jgi:beta-glucanase (GH16 family)